MKNIFRLLVISFGACLLGTSCHGDLQVRQRGTVTASDAWQTQQDAQAQMYGMMSTFRATFTTDYMYWGEYRTGLWGKGNETQPARDQVYNNNIISTHAQADWTSLYTSIQRANLALKYVPGIGFNDEKLRNQILGSAYFVRGFCYYWIARIWGDAPVILVPFESDVQEGLLPARDDASLVFAQAAADFEQAATRFADAPAGIQANMPNLTATYTIQTDLYLWMSKVRGDNSALAKARTACNNAIAAAAEAGKNLTANYADGFDVTKKLGEEIVFAWSMLKDEKEGGFQADWLCAIQYVSDACVENPVKVGSHQQWAAFTPAYKAFIDEIPSDSRARVSYDYFFDAGKNVTHNWVNKYPGTWTGGARVFDSDIPVYRYADIVLFDAEIKNAQGASADAVAALNRIAKRAYGIDNYYSSSLSAQEVEAKLLVERKKEFAAEGKLWWDYIRFDVAFTDVPGLVGRQNERNVLLWPISNASMNRNPNLVQTDFGIE